MTPDIEMEPAPVIDTMLIKQPSGLREAMLVIPAPRVFASASPRQISAGLVGDAVCQAPNFPSFCRLQQLRRVLRVREWSESSNRPSMC